jgi:hypothetical protein
MKVVEQFKTEIQQLDIDAAFVTLRTERTASSTRVSLDDNGPHPSRQLKKENRDERKTQRRAYDSRRSFFSLSLALSCRDSLPRLVGHRARQKNGSLREHTQKKPHSRSRFPDRRFAPRFAACVTEWANRPEQT